MPLIPVVRAIFAIVGGLLLAAGVYLLWNWWVGQLIVYDNGQADRVREDWRLWTGLAIIAWSLFGRLPTLLLAARPDVEPTRPMRTDGEMVTSPTGARLYVETEGSDNGPVVILTHGWGLDSTIWRYLREDLAEARALLPHRVVSWDLPGAGRSRASSIRSIDLENFAIDLEELILAAAPRPIILVGHSIGGMTIQTLARIRPDLTRDKVVGLVLLNTTYTNPLRTMALSKLALALRRPVLEPLFQSTILLQPLAWVSAWQSYLNGTAHLANRLQFGPTVTRSQLDHTTLLGTRNSQAVLAKGNLAMFDWDATAALQSLTCPLRIVAGGIDLVTRPDASVAIQQQASGGRLETVSEANHMGFLERRRHYNTIIIDFIAAVSTGGEAKRTATL